MWATSSFYTLSFPTTPDPLLPPSSWLTWHPQRWWTDTKSKKEVVAGDVLQTYLFTVFGTRRRFYRMMMLMAGCWLVSRSPIIPWVAVMVIRMRRRERKNNQIDDKDKHVAGFQPLSVTKYFMPSHAQGTGKSNRSPRSPSDPSRVSLSKSPIRW